MYLSELRIRELVWKRGITISELASMAGISRQTASSVINGKSCSPDSALKISEALGVPLEKLEDRRRRG